MRSAQSAVKASVVATSLCARGARSSISTASAASLVRDSLFLVSESRIVKFTLPLKHINYTKVSLISRWIV